MHVHKSKSLYNDVSHYMGIAKRLQAGTYERRVQSTICDKKNVKFVQNYKAFGLHTVADHPESIGHTVGQ